MLHKRKKKKAAYSTVVVKRCQPWEHNRGN